MEQLYEAALPEEPERLRRPQPVEQEPARLEQDRPAPMPSASPAGPVEETSEPTGSWQDVLWREWANAEDEEYAQHLFELVKQIPLDWTVRTLLALLGTGYGLLMGYLIGLIGVNWTSGDEAWVLSGAMLGVSAWLGGVAGGVLGLVVSQWLPCSVWLGLLTPNAFAKKLGVLGIVNVGLVVGLLAGLFELNFVPASCFIMALLAVVSRVVSFLKNINAGSMIIAGIIGLTLGGWILLEGWVGLAIALVLGIWLGLTWGSSLLWLGLTWLALIGGWLAGAPAGWLMIWLGLGSGFGLGMLPHLVGPGVDAATAYTYRAWYFWWRKLPPLSQIEQALPWAQAEAGGPEAQKFWTHVMAHPEPVYKDLNQLMRQAFRSPDWVERMTARRALIRRGHEAVEPLRTLAADQTSRFKDVALWLLAGIEATTTQKFAGRLRDILCPDCLARFGRHPVEVLWGITFSRYGCRVCGQDQKVLEDVPRIVAVLDASWPKANRLYKGGLRVNWLQRRSLFDFGVVEIVQASDEEVERFAVQVGNDTDPLRRARYPKMACVIRPGCQLSENTIKILQRTFGQVRHEA